MLIEFFNENKNILGVVCINGESFVHFHLDNGFIIPTQSLPAAITVTGPTTRGDINYVILSSASLNVDEILDVVSGILTFNRNKRDKEALFEATLKSLERIFNESSVEDLKSLVDELTKKNNNE